MELCCLPYAGGSASMFYRLGPLVSPEIQIVPLELPGRGARSDEAPLCAVREMAKDAARQILSGVRGEYALMGYSMGGWVTYETLRVLEAQNRLPKAVLLCASNPPMLIEDSADIADLPDEAFVQAVINMGGMPKDMSPEDLEILRMFLPYMRCDFRAISAYHYEPAVLPVSAKLIYSDSERETVAAWRECFSEQPEQFYIPGGHFFIHTHLHRFAQTIDRALGYDKE